jgi:TonB family protein
MFARLGLLAAALSVALGADVSGPSQFYIAAVRPVYLGEAGPPLLYYRVTDVTRDGPDTRIRFVDIAPVDSACTRPVVHAVEVRLPNVMPAELAQNNNPCATTQKAVRGSTAKYSFHAGGVDTASLGLVAICGSSPVVFELAEPSRVDLDRMRRARPEIARLWGLDRRMMDRVFGGRDIFQNRSEEDDLQIQGTGAHLVGDLASGRYDAGLRAAIAGIGDDLPSMGFREVLSDYRGPISPKEVAARRVHIVDGQLYHFARYAPPIYPPLAKQARVEGRVELQLKVEPSTGEIRDTKALSGHQLLVPSALAAVKRWRFDPGSVASGDVTLALEYSLNCP